MPVEICPSASTRLESFPAGLRVLVVDDDPTWLKILEKMLRKCCYEVTTCGLARDALDMLREKKDRFDIVISDVNMPDMDGFKLLEHVGLEMDLPVIMMSVDGETSRVMKGVQHGACDYLLKPVRMKELRNIWQHVYRKKIHEVKEIGSIDSNEDIHSLRNSFEDFDERQILSGTDINFVRKRKDFHHREHSDHDSVDPTTLKKARVVWSVDLHQKFVNAVNQIGFDKVGPKKILDLMNVPGLTRENVASHLQKYRLYLSRLQKQNEGKNIGRSIPSDYHNNEHSKSFTTQNSFAMQQNIVASRYEGASINGHMQSDFSSKDLPRNFSLPSSLLVEQNVSSNYVYTTQNIQAQGVIPQIKADDLKTIVSLQMTESNIAVKDESHDSHNVSQLGLVLSLKGRKAPTESKSCEATTKQMPWNGTLPVVQFMQHLKQSHEPFTLSMNDSSLIQVEKENDIVDHLHMQPAVISITCNTEREKKTISQIKPICMDYRSGHVQTVAPVACTIDSVTLQVEHEIINSQGFGAESDNSEAKTVKDLCLDQASKCALISPIPEKSLKNGTELVSLPEDLCLYSLEGYGCFENLGLCGMELFEGNHSSSDAEVHGGTYDELEFNSAFQYDSIDYTLVDDSLFT